MVEQKSFDWVGFVEFAKAYRAASKREIGSVPYTENGEQKQSNIYFLDIYDLSLKKKRGEISDIQLSPQLRGEIAGTVSSYLSEALAMEDEFPIEKREERTKELLKQAISGMILLDLTTNRTLLHKIEKTLKDDKYFSGKYTLETTLVELFSEFGMIGKYYSDLSDLSNFGDMRIILPTIQGMLRPERPLGYAEAFQKGFEQVYNRKFRDTYDRWGYGLDLPKVSYIENGERKGKRLNGPPASNIVELSEKILTGEGTQLTITPTDQGRLYGYLKMLAGALVDEVESDLRKRERPGRKPYIEELDHESFVSVQKRIITNLLIPGLFIAGRLNHIEVEGMVSGLYGKIPNLRTIVSEEMSKYAGRTI